ncbi:9946_t:CDS:2, partial [Gigaspora rosea]
VQIMNPESTYHESVPTNIMTSGWNNAINGIDILYENNQFDLRNQFESENNFIVNSGSYMEELLFRNWNYEDDRFGELYTNNHTEYDAIKLAEKLTACILEEDKKTEYALFRASVPKAVLVATANTIFPNVCKIIHKYLTVEILKIQEDQIKQSLQYHTIIVAQSELQRYLTINLDDHILYSKNQDFDIIAKSMLNLVDTSKIVEQLETMDWNSSVPHLNTLIEGSVYEMQDVNRKTIDKCKLYGEAWGKARVALMVAVRRHELDPKEQKNPPKCKGKGWPKRTDRIRQADEPVKKAK